MTHTDARWLFLQCIGKLLAFATSKDIKLICTDFDRSPAEQAAAVKNAKSTVNHSQHQDWLAMDFIIIDANGDPVWDHVLGDTYEVLGDYWLSLHEFCRWGGNFGSTATKPGWDAGHFEVGRDALK